MGFNFHMIGMVAVVLAIVGFFIYHYRKKNQQPRVVKRDRGGYADSPYGGEFPTACPCGCGLNWAGDMPYPPHYTTPPYVKTRTVGQTMGNPTYDLRPGPDPNPPVVSPWLQSLVSQQDVALRPDDSPSKQH